MSAMPSSFAQEQLTNDPPPDLYRSEVSAQGVDWQICDTDVAVDDGVIVPLKPGGCLFWHGLLHHGSPPNHSALSRRALQYHYKPASAGKISKEERMQLFGGEIAAAQC